MRDPEVFLAYAPRGPGLRCALAYLKDGRDVYGWFTGLDADGMLASRYFFFENFYVNAPTGYAATEDLHADWPLDEARRHELARTQDAFAREWLASGDPAEIEAYDADELAVGELNVRHARLGAFSKLQPTWTHYSPGFERTVLNALAKRWPLDYAPDGD
jgi:hypothetical protein